MGRRRRTRQRGRIRPRRRRGGWGERRTRAARKPGMAGAWRCVRAAVQNREEERRRLTGGPGGKILFISFFFLGCDRVVALDLAGEPVSGACGAIFVGAASALVFRGFCSTVMTRSLFISFLLVGGLRSPLSSRVMCQRQIVRFRFFFGAMVFWVGDLEF